jgi:hypothetical protein
MDTSITSMCNITQEDLGETIIPFSYKWRSLASRCHIDIPKREKVDMFIQTVLGPLKFTLQIHCCTNFMDLVEKGV